MYYDDVFVLLVLVILEILDGCYVSVIRCLLHYMGLRAQKHRHSSLAGLTINVVILGKAN
jgi:hypothetical protein